MPIVALGSRCLRSPDLPGTALGPADRIEIVGWVSRYELDLFSNFTFGVDDPDDGDGIVQRDDRWLYGGRAEWIHAVPETGVVLTTGVELRADGADVRLGHQRSRRSIPGGPNRENDIFEIWPREAPGRRDLRPTAGCELARLGHRSLRLARGACGRVEGAPGAAHGDLERLHR